MTPIEANVRPTYFALITPSEIEEFARLKNDYRALKLTSNMLAKQDKPR